MDPQRHPRAGRPRKVRGVVKTSAELRTEDLAALKEIAEIELTSVNRLIQKAVRAWLDNYRTTQAAHKIHSAAPSPPIGEHTRLPNAAYQTDPGSQFLSSGIVNKSHEVEPNDPDVCEYCAVPGCEGECRIKKGGQ